MTYRQPQFLVMAIVIIIGLVVFAVIGGWNLVGWLGKGWLW